MLWRRLLLSIFLVIAPLSLLGGCGGGVSLSGPNSNTQTGLGTVVVGVSGATSDTVVFLDKIARPLRDREVIFYDVAPGKHVVTATSSLSFSSSRSVTVVADRTLSVSLEAPSGFITPVPFITPFGN